MQTRRQQSTVGVMIREWRQSRGLSQLILACSADISTRHLSFLETGRARPSEEMVHQLAHALDVPPHERNVLLIAAGFTPLHTSPHFHSEEMATTKDLVTRMLEENEPFCAAAIDRHWNILAANKTYWGLTGGEPENTKTATDVPNLLKRLFAAEAFRETVTNWEEVAYSLIQRLHREAIAELNSNDTQTANLLEHLMTAHDLPTTWQVVDMSMAQPPLIPMKIHMGGRNIELITTITTLGTPLDASRHEIRIETFLPADEPSRENWSTLFSQTAAV